MLEQTFASLAILKVNADHKNKDYIEYFIPFVVEAVRLSDNEVIVLDEIQRRIAQEFGLRIPLNALKTIIGRAENRGYVSRKHGVYHRNEGAQFDLGIISERERFLRSHSTLIEKLISFVGNRYQKHWTPENAEGGLFSYLEKNSGPLLATAIKGSPLAPLSSSTISERDADYIINAFIDYLHKSDAPGFDFLETIVKGRMLADVLLFEDLNVVKKPFNGVEVYFDTQFMMRVLGCSGESLEAPCTELIQLLRSHGAFLRIFDHTFEETTGILERAAYALRSSNRIGNRRGEALEYFINENFRSSDIDLIIQDLPDNLDRLQIKMKPAPTFTNPLGVDEVKLRAALQAGIGYKDPDGAMMDNDVASLTAIHRLRGGASQPRIESCVAIFVTSNHSLVRAAGRYFQDEHNFSKVPLCMLDFVLATLVWLKEPLQTSSELPHKRIIASCYAAMKPDDSLWEKYLDEADSLRRQGKITENSLQLAKSSQRILMDITRGDALGFSEGTVLEVIEVAREEIRQEEAEKLQANHNEERQKLERRNLETADELSREAELRREALQKLSEKEEIQQNKKERAKRNAKILARAAYWIVVGCLSFLTVLELYYQHHEAPKVSGYGFKKYILPSALGIVAVLGLVHLILGLSVAEIGRKIEKRLEHFFEDIILKLRDLE